MVPILIVEQLQKVLGAIPTVCRLLHTNQKVFVHPKARDRDLPKILEYSVSLFQLYRSGT